MSQHDKKAIVFLAAVLLIGGGLYWYDNKMPPVEPNPPTQPPPSIRPSPWPPAPLPDGIEKGIISPSKNGKSVYTNKKYGFSFTFPSEWRVGDDSLGYGTLQFFNYDESEGVGGHKFQSGQNKIEMRILSSDSIYIDENASSAFPTETIENRRLTVAGQAAFMERIRLVNGEEILKSYKIILHKIPDSGIAIVIYGDTKNFFLLDRLVESIEWVE